MDKVSEGRQDEGGNDMGPSRAGGRPKGSREVGLGRWEHFQGPCEGRQIAEYPNFIHVTVGVLQRL